MDAIDVFKQTGLARALRRRRGLRRFLSENGVGSHYGVFRSFGDARKWAPASPEFDDEAFVDEYIHDRTQRVFAFDYPMMFWLKQAFEDGASSIFDIGGSVGNHYYAYSKFISFPETLNWQVLERPVSVKLGEQLSAQQRIDALRFTDRFDPGRVAAHVWIAAGAIEFFEHMQIHSMLPTCSVKPTHILINKAPLHDGDTFVSTQNIGRRAFVPHWVYNRRQYIDRIVHQGFRLVDQWEVPERAFIVHGQPHISFSPYGGLYFKATSIELG